MAGVQAESIESYSQKIDKLFKELLLEFYTISTTKGSNIDNYKIQEFETLCDDLYQIIEYNRILQRQRKLQSDLSLDKMQEEFAFTQKLRETLSNFTADLTTNTPSESKPEPMKL